MIQDGVNLNREELQEFITNQIKIASMIPMVAKNFYLFYEFLIKEGFTPEQALEIIKTRGLSFVN